MYCIVESYIASNTDGVGRSHLKRIEGSDLPGAANMLLIESDHNTEVIQ